MDKVSVSKIADFIGGRLCGEDCFVTNITTDSRNAVNGTMFIGIKGERVDGNDFATDFLKNGGMCAVVEKDIEIPDGKSVVFVDDTKKAIRDIAEYYRKTLEIDVIGVTGSVGKTSTKDMLFSVVSKGFETNATKGNFNNEIGVPLTVFGLDSGYKKAIIEMGMSNLGEISRLTKIAKPDVAVITNIGTAHIGNLGSRENILKAKLEILEGMPSSGLVVLNGDDSMLWGSKDKIDLKTIYCAIENQDADVVAYDVVAEKNGTEFKLKIDEKEYKFKINTAGRHHVYNAMAAVVCGLHFGMNVEDIIKGVADFAPTGMRQKEIEVNGIKMIEDCYNASADSMKSSLETLKSVGADLRTIAVLGDMLEQGDFAEENHRLVGVYSAENNVDTLVTVGNDSRFIADEAKKQGVKNIFEFSDNESTANFLATYVKKGDIVLFKASRGMKLEEVSSKLQNILKG